MRSDRLATLLGARHIGEPSEFSGVCTDSRAAVSGMLFVALRGKRFDAHAFIPDVLRQGARVVVVERALPDMASVAQVLVSDTQRALGDIAKLLSQDCPAKRIALTGSCGKTTVKELTALILSEMGEVLATRGNFNNEIGVPLTLLRLQPSHRYGVFELGANHAGEIAYTASLVNPDIVLVNNAARAHLEGFGSLDGVARAKGEIYQQLKPQGTAVINADDQYADFWESLLSGQSMLRFSIRSPSADVCLLGVTSGTEDLEARLQIRTPLGILTVPERLHGEHNRLNVLAAITLAMAAGASAEAIVAGLSRAEPVIGRLRFIELNGVTLIDDTYNANPDAMKRAIDVLVEGPARTRLLVCGDMAELGEHTSEAHREIGAYALDRGVDRVIAIGAQAPTLLEGFGRTNGQRATTHQQVVDMIKRDWQPGLRLLVKGSRSAGLDEVVRLLVDAVNEQEAH